jgi:hypothetical protein
MVACASEQTFPSVALKVCAARAPKSDHWGEATRLCLLPQYPYRQRAEVAAATPYAWTFIPHSSQCMHPFAPDIGYNA